MSILVVDDQAINRITLSRILETFDLTVLQATNGQEGLQLYLQHRVSICCIFLDLMMPVLDGWSTALKIRRMEEDNEWHPAPIIAYTSEDVPQGSANWQRCIQSGMNDVVGKPVSRTFTYQLLLRHLPFWAESAPPPPAPSTCASGSARSSLDLGSLDLARSTAGFSSLDLGSPTRSQARTDPGWEGEGGSTSSSNSNRGTSPRLSLELAGLSQNPAAATDMACSGAGQAAGAPPTLVFVSKAAAGKPPTQGTLQGEAGGATPTAAQRLLQAHWPGSAR